MGVPEGDLEGLRAQVRKDVAAGVETGLCLGAKERPWAEIRATPKGGGEWEVFVRLQETAQTKRCKTAEVEAMVMTVVSLVVAKLRKKAQS